MFESEKISTLLPKSWKNLFNSGIIIPTKMRFCNECNDKRTCNKCNNQVNEIKEFRANFNLLRSQPANEFDYVLPDFKEKDYLIVKARLLCFLFSFFDFIYVSQSSYFFGISFF